MALQSVVQNANVMIVAVKLATKKLAAAAPKNRNKPFFRFVISGIFVW